MIGLFSLVCTSKRYCVCASGTNPPNDRGLSSIVFACVAMMETSNVSFIVPPMNSGTVKLARINADLASMRISPYQFGDEMNRIRMFDSRGALLSRCVGRTPLATKSAILTDFSVGSSSFVSPIMKFFTRSSTVFPLTASILSLLDVLDLMRRTFMSSSKRNPSFLPFVWCRVPKSCAIIISRI